MTLSQYLDLQDFDSRIENNNLYITLPVLPYSLLRDIDELQPISKVSIHSITLGETDIIEYMCELED